MLPARTFAVPSLEAVSRFLRTRRAFRAPLNVCVVLAGYRAWRAGRACAATNDRIVADLAAQLSYRRAFCRSSHGQFHHIIVYVIGKQCVTCICCASTAAVLLCELRDSVLAQWEAPSKLGSFTDGFISCRTAMAGSCDQTLSFSWIPTPKPCVLRCVDSCLVYC